MRARRASRWLEVGEADLCRSSALSSGVISTEATGRAMPQYGTVWRFITSYFTDRTLATSIAVAEVAAIAVVAQPRRRAWIAVAAAMLVLGAFGGGWAVSLFRQPPTDDQVIRFQITPPEGVAISGGGNLGGGFAVSPDGQTAAFIGVAKGKTGLWVRPLNAANSA